MRTEQLICVYACVFKCIYVYVYLLLTVPMRCFFMIREKYHKNFNLCDRLINFVILLYLD